MYFYGRYIEAEHVSVVTVSAQAHGMGVLPEGKKIVLLADLHLSGFGKREADILQAIDAIEPDLILLGGDYIQWHGAIDGAMTFLSRLSAPDGVYGVMGDYDYSDSRQSCLFCHEKNSGKPTRRHSVTWLRNSAHRLSIDGQDVWIAGIDNAYGGGAADLQQAIDSRTPMLVLSHSPLAFDEFSENHPVFMLAGDTHGGQIRLPGWVYRMFGYQKNVDYNYGLFHRGDKTLYVTRGTGTSHVKFRLFCPPEIVEIQF